MPLDTLNEFDDPINDIMNKLLHEFRGEFLLLQDAYGKEHGKFLRGIKIVFCKRSLKLIHWKLLDDDDLALCDGCNIYCNHNNL